MERSELKEKPNKLQVDAIISSSLLSWKSPWIHKRKTQKTNLTNSKLWPIEYKDFPNNQPKCTQKEKISRIMPRPVKHCYIINTKSELSLSLSRGCDIRQCWWENACLLWVNPLNSLYSIQSIQWDISRFIVLCLIHNFMCFFYHVHTVPFQPQDLLKVHL